MTLPLSRRQLLKAGGALGTGFVASAFIPSFASASTYAALGFPALDDLRAVPLRDDPAIKRMALRAIDAARSAGARYADVRLIREDRRMSLAVEERWIKRRQMGARQSLTIGVRALVGGYWGYASSTVWSVDEAARLGAESVRQAKIATAGKSRVVDLAPVKMVATGHWETTVEIDPVTVSWEELNDFARGTSSALDGAPMDLSLFKWDRAFASTDGAYATQTTYRASMGGGPVMSVPDGKYPSLTVAAAGWEYLRNYPYFDQQDESSEWMKPMIRRRSTDPVVGRFPVVIAPELIAYMASPTIGQATELDRMLGYRANNQGTSYLGEPLEMLGTEAVGSSLVSVTADRTMAKGCATVRWDDEGVETSSYPLVEKGILADCVTTRESASWLAPYYQHSGGTLTSRAAMSTRDNDAPETSTPNLTFAPGTSTSIDELCAQVPGTGYVMMSQGPNIKIDYQQLNGFGKCFLFEVRNGKRVGYAGEGMFLFRAPELWRNVLAAGDATTARTIGVEYGQEMLGWFPMKTVLAHTISAVPMRVKEMTFIPNRGMRL